MTTQARPFHPRLTWPVWLVTILGFLAAPLSATPVTFDIPAQPVPAALQLFIKQSGAKVLFVYDDLKDVQSKAVKGEFEPDAAIDQLLAQTGFIVKGNGGGKFVVARQGVETPGSIEGVVRAADSGRGVAGARVEIAGTDKFVLTDKRGRFTFDEAPTGDQELHITAEGMQNTKVTDVTVKPGHRHTLSSINIPAKAPGVVQLDTFVVSAKKNDGIIELDPYSVEGQREKPFTTANVDIPRSINDAQPYYIFDSKALEQSAAPNLTEFLKERLTMNATRTTNAQNASNGSILGNMSSINLRGLGTDSTLILVNGRRVAGVSIQGNDYQPDINGIPISAVERIEILPASASGIYGASAVGGVVNVILKQDYVGGEIRATYNNTFDTDAPRRSVSMSYGQSLESGKTHLMLAASWSDGKPPLLQDRRGFMDRGIATILMNSPSFVYAANNPFLGSLPNVTPSSAVTASLVLKGGVSLGSRNSYVPAGTTTTTPSSTLIAGFVANAGQWNFELPNSTQSPTGLLRPLEVTPKARGIQLTLRRQMTPHLELFADFSYNENRSQTLFNVSTFFTVSSAAPSNPFSQTVRISLPNATNVPNMARSENRTLTVGALIRLPRDWQAEADYTRSSNNYQYRYASLDSPALSAAIRDGTFNPFVDTLLTHTTLDPFLGLASFAGKRNLDTFAARGSGPLWVTPWGVISAVFGAEHRTNNAPESVSETVPPVSDGSRTIYYPREERTESGYAEFTVPLIKKNLWPFVHMLDFQLSGRSEHYAVDAGTVSTTRSLQTGEVIFNSGPTLNGQPYQTRAKYESSNYTTGIRFSPVKGLMMRASVATAFLPPAPGQLIRSPLPDTSLTTVADPKNGLISTSVQTISGGNPDLRPQSSKSLNIGLVWTPERSGVLKGLRADLEYYRIRQANAISALDAQGIVNLESVFPDRVRRDEANTITQVDVSLLNLFKKETEGWDISVDYETPTPIGMIRVRVVESIIKHLRQQVSLTLPNLDYVGFPAEGGAAKYKTNASLIWERAGWASGLTVRHVGSYKQYGAAGGPASIQFGNGNTTSTYVPAQGGDIIPSQTYWDMFCSYTFGEKIMTRSDDRWRGGRKALRGLSIQIGVKNIFNKMPPYDVYYGYYFSTFGDAWLRNYSLSIRKTF